MYIQKADNHTIPVRKTGTHIYIWYSPTCINTTLALRKDVIVYYDNFLDTWGSGQIGLAKRKEHGLKRNMHKLRVSAYIPISSQFSAQTLRDAFDHRTRYYSHKPQGGRWSHSVGGVTLLELGTSSCKAFILSAILSLRNCNEEENQTLYAMRIEPRANYNIHKMFVKTDVNGEKMSSMTKELEIR